MWRASYAVPPEHGAWIWWIGPLCIGVAAGERFSTATLFVIVAALAGFLSKQPLTVGISVIAGRRDTEDLAPAAVWGCLYASVGAAAAAGIWLTGHSSVVLLPLLGTPVYVWYMIAVARGAARRNTLLDAAGAGVLALTAPAAYWASGGTDPRMPWVLWSMAACQSIASVVHVVAQLHYARQERKPDLALARRINWPALTGHTAALGVGAVAAAAGLAPWHLAIAFLVAWIDGVDGTLRPPYGARPMRIGIRQLVVSAAFVTITCIGFVGFAANHSVSGG